MGAVPLGHSNLAMQVCDYEACSNEHTGDRKQSPIAQKYVTEHTLSEEVLTIALNESTIIFARIGSHLLGTSHVKVLPRRISSLCCHTGNRLSYTTVVQSLEYVLYQL
jgi:hypothetical protein